MTTGPVAALGATVAGILLGRTLSAGPGRGALAAAALCVAGAWATPRARAAFVLLGLALLSTALTLRARDGLDTADHDLPLDVVTATVELTADPFPLHYETRAVARSRGHLVLVRAPRPASSHLAVVGAGDRLVVLGRFQRLSSDDAERWNTRHVATQVTILDVLGVSGPRSPLMAVAGEIRGLVLTGSEELGSPERGLVAGFLVGDTRSIPDRMVDEFRASGLSHLLAVSGANVAFVLVLAGPLLRRLGLRARLAAVLGLLSVFLAVTRFEPSVLRATAMAALATMAWFLGRPVPTGRILTLAVTALLLFDPFLLDSVAFRLSCAASAGIVVLAGPIAARLRGPASLREALAVTLAAQLGVAPVLIPTFGSMPVVAPASNLLAAPLVGPLTVWGLVSGVLSGLVRGPLPEIAEFLQAPTFLLARGVAAVASLGARVPWSIGAREAWLLTALGFVVAAARKRSRRLGVDAAPARPS